MSALYNKLSFEISKLITRTYSTSFSFAVRSLNPEMRMAIYSIYGFVRIADEIVDTFHNHKKDSLLTDFENDYYTAYLNGISLNPVLHSFQEVVKTYDIPDDLIQAFLTSMKSDLKEKDYTGKNKIDQYIYGSAEAVGLMCLKVFTNNNEAKYEDLKLPAMKLGSAFQKVNFLRDLKNDIELLGRHYFPIKGREEFSETMKMEIVRDIRNDFSLSYEGIKRLPKEAKVPVLTAYLYFYTLLIKISHTPASDIINKRIRISNFRKALLYLKAFLMCKMKMI